MSRIEQTIFFLNPFTTVVYLSTNTEFICILFLKEILFFRGVRFTCDVTRYRSSYFKEFLVALIFFSVVATLPLWKSA